MTCILAEREVECVGRAFLIHYLKRIVYNASHDTTQHRRSQKKKKTKKKKDIKVQVDWDCPLDDYYALLGIKQYEMNISPDNLKRAYRKVSLLMHPDKAPAEHRGQAEARYKLIQTAFDALSDPFAKLKYDSQIEFDQDIPDDRELARIALTDSDAVQQRNAIPSDLEHDSDYEENVKLFNATGLDHLIHCDEAKFYALFAPYFAAWSRYARGKGIPLLGDEKSSTAHVKKFYASWRKFKSWRLFLHEDDIKDNVMDPSSADNNREKKWMMKENEVLQAPYKKDESVTVQTMVEAAYIRDPRVCRMLKQEKVDFLRDLKDKKDRRRRRQFEREEKERAQVDFLRDLKDKKDRRRRRQFEREEKERARLDAERKVAQAKLEVEQKKQREMDRKREELSAVPLQLRTLCNEEHFTRATHIKSDDIDDICYNAGVADMKSILAESNKTKQVQRFEAVLVAAQRIKEEKRKTAQEKKKRKELEKQQKAGKPWSEDEMTVLVNAVGRFPGGTSSRWEKIQRAVGKQRTVDEIIAKVKEIQKKGRKQKTSKSADKKTKNAATT
eukprot:CAMPEP_0202732822 /NCGR_PEP_ID=MMETSP1385-20130828/187856_1 /ASSEMBLY_ACC=CAM_ASM_000861 /TAXON_ID=933848 /ORGANISM="Elphidium margaritaceum" /LENGTH=556 /DNA_ID=CAMNT_0049399145 /DNA_START=31 /DNA_END=1697 /DNA_ORIENTATION=+